MSYDAKAILKASAVFLLGIALFILALYLDWRSALLVSMGLGVMEIGIGLIKSETTPKVPFTNKSK